MRSGSADRIKTLFEKLKKNKYVLVVILVGLVLILLPTGGTARENAATSEKSARTEFSVEEQERKISGALSEISGAGKVTVILTLKTGTEQIIAIDEENSESVSGGENQERKTEKSTSAVIISSGSSIEDVVTLKYIYPEYLGALVVAEGAGNATVKLQLTEAVAALTGLGTNKITVTKMRD